MSVLIAQLGAGPCRGGRLSSVRKQMKVEPQCSPKMPALQVKEEPRQTVKPEGAPPLPGGGGSGCEAPVCEPPLAWPLSQEPRRARIAA